MNDTKYPCDCEPMKFMMNNHDLFILKDDGWYISWIIKEYDEKRGIINLPRLGVKFDHCMFCGKKIKG